MFKCVPYNETMRDEWDRLALQKGTIFHTTAFRQILLTSFGYQCVYHAVVNPDNHICALMPLVAGRNLGMAKAAVSLPFINYLDICADSEAAACFALQSLPKLKDTFQLDYIQIRLKDQMPDDAGWKVSLQHHTFVLPLLPDEDQVLSLSAASNRNHVRKVYKNEWFTVSFDPHHLEAFYQVYVRRMKQLGSPAPAISFFRTLFTYLPQNAFLLSVLDRETKQVVGGMILLTSPANQTLYYPYGANLVEYNGKYLNNFMYWEAVRFGTRSGMNYLDLGRSQTGSGTYRYKEQWGAKAEQLRYLVYDGGHGSAGPPDKGKLSFFIEVWKAAPAFITNRAGKILIKYLFP